jgi:hypothetical protein
MRYRVVGLAMASIDSLCAADFAGGARAIDREAFAKHAWPFTMIPTDFGPSGAARRRTPEDVFA